MPRTRNRITTLAQRKRKKPDDEASLSSASSFDSSSNKNAAKQKSEIRKKSPRKRPSRKRERLDKPEASEEQQEQQVALKEVVVMERTVSKLTPKKRALREVEEASSSYQIEINRRKTGKKKEETTKRTKVSAPVNDLTDTDDGETSDAANVNQEEFVRNGGPNNDTVTTSQPDAAESLAVAADPAYLLNPPLGLLGEDAEEDEIAAALPFAISTSGDELDGSLPAHDSSAFRQALVTPQQQPSLYRGENDNASDIANDTSNQSSFAASTGDNIEAPLHKDSGDYFHLPPHVSTEKAELDHHTHQEDASAAVGASDEDATNGKGDDDIMRPRSLLHTLEKDKNNSPTPTTSTNEEDADNPAANGTGADITTSSSSVEVMNPNESAVVSHVEEVVPVVVRSQGTQQQRKVRWQPTVQEFPAPPPRQPPSSFLPVKDLKPRTPTARVVSPSTAMLNASYHDDDNHHRQVINDTDTLRTRRNKRLLLLVFLAYCMIAISDIFAIGAVMVPPKWTTAVTNMMIIPTTSISSSTSSSYRQLNQMAITVNQMHKDNTEILEESGTNLMSSMHEIRQEVFVRFEDVLDGGKGTFLAVANKMQDYSSAILKGSNEILWQTSNKIREEFSATVPVVMQGRRDFLLDSVNMIGEYSHNAVLVLDNVRAMLWDSVNKIYDSLATLLVNNGSKLLDSMYRLRDSIVDGIQMEKPVVSDATFASNNEKVDSETRLPDEEMKDEVAATTETVNTVDSEPEHSQDDRIESEEPTELRMDHVPVSVSQSATSMESKNEQMFATNNEKVDSETREPDEEMKDKVAATTETTNTLDNEPEHSQDYPIEREEPTELTMDHVPVSVSQSPTSMRSKNEQMLPLTNRILEEIYEEAIPDTKIIDVADTEESSSEDGNESEWDLSKESEPSSEPEIIDQIVVQENALPKDSLPNPGSSIITDEQQAEESESRDGQSIDHAIDDHSERRIQIESATESHADQNDKAIKNQDTNSLGVSQKRVRFADDSSIQKSDKAEIDDEASLTDTTVDSSEDQSVLDELSEEIARIDLDSGEEQSPKPNHNEQAPSLGRLAFSVPPKIISLAAILNSTISTKNGRLSNRLINAKNTVFKKHRREKPGLRKRFSLMLSRFTAILREQKKDVMSTRWKGSKLGRSKRDPSKRASSVLTKSKSFIGLQMAVIGNRLKKLLPLTSKKEAPRVVLSMTPVQPREPVGAPILQKYKVAKKSNMEKSAKLQNARRDDSKHPGNVGRELLRKVRPAIVKSSQAMVQWVKRRFLATKALMRQDSIEESML
ncbi:unnamed protein product [Cylindrotheca closterium]|uniref:Uncharacterized protein n=1 Tax=Cylindrotheca closterium TaxID=2856 RepID=A0AAD2G1H7_9STRA|nr:unnamed protein product [Cylindrotheca closterium]